MTKLVSWACGQPIWLQLILLFIILRGIGFLIYWNKPDNSNTFKGLVILLASMVGCVLFTILICFLLMSILAGRDAAMECWNTVMPMIAEAFQSLPGRIR